jgi:hypothetical protein
MLAVIPWGLRYDLGLCPARRGLRHLAHGRGAAPWHAAGDAVAVRRVLGEHKTFMGIEFPADGAPTFYDTPRLTSH